MDFRATLRDRSPQDLAPVAAAGLLFLVLFWTPMRTLAHDWWRDPDAGHGLLLAPIAFWLAWRKGLATARPEPWTGAAILVAAVALRWVSGLAVELFTMRASLWLAGVGIIVFVRGWPQVARWWLPLTLLALTIPLPEVVLSSLALPLQLRASAWGAAALAWRDVPVLLDGNVIRLPQRQLFVTEACSGLRSLTALIALGVLIGGLWMKHPASRVVILLLAIPVAMVVNGIRVFLTGFLVYYVSPSLGEGFMHYTEGWVLFVAAFGFLGAAAWVLARLESRWLRGATA